MQPRALVPVAMMAALTAVGAQLRIPLPHVPVTLQAAFACLAGLLLGSGRGAASQAVYLAAGLMGFPVFAGGGGLHYVLAPSFGYLLGFVGGAWTAGRVAGSRPGLARATAAAWAGMGVIYAAGVAVLYLNLRFLAAAGASRQDAAIGVYVLQLGLAPLPKDLLVGLLAAWVSVRLRRRVGHASA